MKSTWSWSKQRGNQMQDRETKAGRDGAIVPTVVLAAGLLVGAMGSASAQRGTPMTPERLNSLTQGRTMTVRVRATSLTQVNPSITQQVMYRIRLTPDRKSTRLN